MPLHFRKNVRIPPLRFTLSGWPLRFSWGLKIGRWTWNPRTRRHSVDLPGPINWRSK